MPLGPSCGAAFPNELESKYLPLTEQVFRVQKQTIEEAAKQGPAVFIGRCADAILQDRDDVLRVFVYADIERENREPLKNMARWKSVLAALSGKTIKGDGFIMKTIPIKDGGIGKTTI